MPAHKRPITRRPKGHKRRGENLRSTVLSLPPRLGRCHVVVVIAPTDFLASALCLGPWPRSALAAHTNAIAAVDAAIDAAICGGRVRLMLLLKLLLVVLVVLELVLVLMLKLLMHGARVLGKRWRRVMMASIGRLCVIECMEGVGKVILQGESTHRGRLGQHQSTSNVHVHGLAHVEGPQITQSKDWQTAPALGD